MNPPCSDIRELNGDFVTANLKNRYLSLNTSTYKKKDKNRGLVVTNWFRAAPTYLKSSYVIKAEGGLGEEAIIGIGAIRTF